MKNGDPLEYSILATIEPAEIGFAGPADQQTEPEPIITMTPPGEMNGAKCRAL